MKRKKLLLCGASGFIGRNLLSCFLQDSDTELYACVHKTPLPPELAEHPRLHMVSADLTNTEDVSLIVAGMDAVIQAAGVTSGAKQIVSAPHVHVTDNAVMNALLFRACHDHNIKHLIYFSCIIMYPQSAALATESDFTHEITDEYFGAGWTKVYAEKMCEFYSRLGNTRFTVIRHSNIYGPHDKYDFERSHVFGATVAKVMGAKDGKVVIWGDGSEMRDLLYVDDLVALVHTCLDKQATPYELINAGSGQLVSVADLVHLIMSASGKQLALEFDNTKPTIAFSVAVDSGRAERVFGWTPKTSLADGIKQSLQWYRNSHQP